MTWGRVNFGGLQSPTIQDLPFGLNQPDASFPSQKPHKNLALAFACLAIAFVFVREVPLLRMLGVRDAVELPDSVQEADVSRAPTSEMENLVVRPIPIGRFHLIIIFWGEGSYLIWEGYRIWYKPDLRVVDHSGSSFCGITEVVIPVPFCGITEVVISRSPVLPHMGGIACGPNLDSLHSWTSVTLVGLDHSSGQQKVWQFFWPIRSRSEYMRGAIVGCLNLDKSRMLSFR